MNKKRWRLLAIVIILVAAALWLHLKPGQEKEENSSETGLQNRGLSWEEEYNNLSQQLEEYKTKNEDLSREIASLQKEKEDLLQQVAEFSSPTYLADIVADRTRLKLEVKELDDKIKNRDQTLSLLYQEKERLEVILGEEKSLSGRLIQSMAEEKKKDYALNRELIQKTSSLTALEANINKLQKAQEVLKDKIKGLEGIVQDKNKEIKTLEKKLNEAYRQNKTLENKLTRAREEKELLEEELAATRRLYDEAKASQEALENKLANLLKEKEDLSSQLLATSEKAVSLDGKLEQMEGLLSQEELAKKELEEKYESLSRGNKALEEKLSQKEKEASVMLELTKTVILPEKAPAQEKKENLPPVKGKILASSDKYNFVIINIGENEGVKAGDKFSIYHLDRKIGEIEVTRIRSTSAFANIMAVLEGITISSDDTVR